MRLQFYLNISLLNNFWNKNLVIVFSHRRAGRVVERGGLENR